jgi:hypothetical protein
MEGGGGGFEGAFGGVVGLGTWEEEDAGERDGAGDGGLVEGNGCLLNEETPGLDVFGGLDHAAIADVPF